MKRKIHQKKKQKGYSELHYRMVWEVHRKVLEVHMKVLEVRRMALGARRMVSVEF